MSPNSPEALISLPASSSQSKRQPKQPPSRGAGLKEARPDPAKLQPTSSSTPAQPAPQQSEYTSGEAPAAPAPPPLPPQEFISSFPRSPSEFDKDYRVSYSKADGKWILEADDGSEYVWDEALRRWGLSIDEDLLEQQRQAYRVEGVDETADTIESIKQKKRKRKQQTDSDANNDVSSRQQQQSAGRTKPKRQRVNTAVYVMNLPPDTTPSELHDVFSKCGVIAEQIDNGQPRIKMYENDQGQFKGDALVVYFRPESVQLAVQMLDETEFRFGDKEAGKMKVQPADLSYKVQKDDGSGEPGGGAGGAQGKGRDDWNKKKIQRTTAMLRNKLADWDDDDPQTVTTKQVSKWDKVVILKHMFTLQEIEDDPAVILDIKEDIRDECSKLGDVTNVVLYDKEEDGVVMVRFASPEAARICPQNMNGRFFGGTQIEAYIPSGEVKFRKTGKKAIDIDDLGEGWEVNKDEDDEGQRLEKFSSWIERDA
ncbi:hypothetical protein KEM54_002362 [Ascosphaera aggregata]|nr:hypothetical protein KEM54_002362 [Ascosphaera aggregata]